jgi:hypothetical protein
LSLSDWVTFYTQSVFSAPVSLAVNCFTFDALSHLSDDDANLFFCTGQCFVCHMATHRTEMCPVWGHHMLFCKCLDNPHHKWLFDSSCCNDWWFRYRVGRWLPWSCGDVS